MLCQATLHSAHDVCDVCVCVCVCVCEDVKVVMTEYMHAHQTVCMALKML